MCIIPLKLMKMIIQQKMGKTHKTTRNINKYPQCHCNQIHTNKIPFNSPLCHTINLNVFDYESENGTGFP